MIKQLAYGKSSEDFRYETFITNIAEVFSHPVDTVKIFLHSKSENDLTALRNEIFLNFVPSRFSEKIYKLREYISPRNRPSNKQSEKKIQIFNKNR